MSNFFIFSALVLTYIGLNKLFYSAISIDVSGLGSLMWLKDKLDSWIMGHLRCAVLSTLESIIEKSFKESIKTIQVEMLLEDQ